MPTPTTTRTGLKVKINIKVGAYLSGPPVEAGLTPKGRAAMPTTPMTGSSPTPSGPEGCPLRPTAGLTGQTHIPERLVAWITVSGRDPLHRGS
jgi:hypothetical protein